MTIADPFIFNYAVGTQKYQGYWFLVPTPNKAPGINKKVKHSIYHVPTPVKNPGIEEKIKHSNYLK